MIASTIQRLNQPSLRRLLSTNSPTTHLVVNALGEDRTGIVSDVSRLITDVGGSVGESRAIRLGAHFSMMMLCHVPSDKVELLRNQLTSDSFLKNIQAMVHETTCAKAAEYTPLHGYTGEFKLRGADHPGIVYEVTQLLADSGLNIDHLETSEEIAPYGGTTLFLMDGIATAPKPLPSTFDPNSVRVKLANLGESLNCDITLDDVDEEPASMYGV